MVVLNMARERGGDVWDVKINERASKTSGTSKPVKRMLLFDVCDEHEAN